MAVFVKEYECTTALWDKVYNQYDLEDLTDLELSVEPTFDACLHIFSQHAERVMDFGCGTGDILFQCAQYGHLFYGIGIDRSEVGIQFGKNMANLNHFRQLDFVVGDVSHIVQMEEESFDGIILSNILDVMPKQNADAIMMELTRLLKKDGLMFIKLNPYETDNRLSELGLICFQDNLYEKDGFLRLRRLDTKEWINEFEHNFIIERYLEFPYPWQEGMNRLFLLRKR